MDSKAPQQADRSSQKMAVMEANNLEYKFDDILNVSVNRTMKKQYFDTRTYTLPGAGQAVSTWNSGVDLVDLRNSYLKLDVGIVGGDRAYSFGQGSVLNLIKEIKGLSSSGIELFRTQDANIFNKFMARNKHSQQWFDSTGQLLGYDLGASALTVGVNYTWVIPLCELDIFFDLYDGKLLPANIASGMRIEITWEDVATAFVHDGTGTTDATGYSVSSIEFRTESVTLADSAMAILNKEAATNGLEITYDRVYTSPSNTGASLEDNVEIRKAVSLAKSIMAIQLPTADRVDLAEDSFLAADYTNTSADVRLGNQYYPFQPIENEVEAYFNYLKQYNKLKRSSAETVTGLADFQSGGQAQIVANLETDDSLNLTGLPVNSSRILECRFTRTATTNIRTYAFLTYTALCRASLSNCSVKI